MSTYFHYPRPNSLEEIVAERVFPVVFCFTCLSHSEKPVLGTQFPLIPNMKNPIKNMKHQYTYIYIIIIKNTFLSISYGTVNIGEFLNHISYPDGYLPPPLFVEVVVLVQPAQRAREPVQPAQQALARGAPLLVPDGGENMASVLMGRAESWPPFP